MSPSPVKGKRSAVHSNIELMRDSLEGTALMLGGIGWHTPQHAHMASKSAKRSIPDAPTRVTGGGIPPAPTSLPARELSSGVGVLSMWRKGSGLGGTQFCLLH